MFPLEGLKAVASEVESCRRCPRLVAWREAVAADPPRRYRGESYWARPVAGLRRPGGAGRDRRPGAGGARRQPHRAHLHRRPLRRLALRGAAPGRLRQPARVESAATTGCGCATPTSPRSSAARRRPTSRRPRSATTACPTWSASCELLERCRVIVALGAFAWDGVLRALRARSAPRCRGRGPRFGHGAEADARPLDAARLLPPQPAEHLHRQADRRR